MSQLDNQGQRPTIMDDNNSASSFQEISGSEPPGNKRHPVRGGPNNTRRGAGTSSGRREDRRSGAISKSNEGQQMRPPNGQHRSRSSRGSNKPAEKGAFNHVGGSFQYDSKINDNPKNNNQPARMENSANGHPLVDLMSVNVADSWSSRKNKDTRFREAHNASPKFSQNRKTNIALQNQKDRESYEAMRIMKRYSESRSQENDRMEQSNLKENLNGSQNSGRVVNGKYVSARQNNDRGRKNDFRSRNSAKRNFDRRNQSSDFKKDQAISKQFHNRPSLRPAKNNCPIDSEQARTLIEQLVEESYECMVCCEWIRSSQPLWSCQNCYHLFHLRCIREWIGSEINHKSSGANGEKDGWRCPACRNITELVPLRYTCFCGKVTDPDWNPRDGVTPHSCGELCWKQRKNPPCSHTCNELCHPGPCPSCPVMVLKECHCGKTSAKVRCGHTKISSCSQVCGKVLNCGKHHCSMVCHEGPCESCGILEVQKCHCGKETREQQCGAEQSAVTIDDHGVSRYSCEKACAKVLDCENHICEDICHPGDCASCIFSPKNVEYCPCKQTLIKDLLPPGQERQSCLDPIPCCENFCGKRLPCGPKGKSHLCRRSCHIGDCEPCEGTTMTSCRCGNSEMELTCKEYDPGKDFPCERRCNKKRKCGRHRCNQKCCVDDEHNCNLICGRKLGCGLHKCDEVCHSGNCPRCWQTSFDERFCHCGETVQYPPIPCGTPLPECNNICTRSHPCGHPPKHNCHNEDACPPCVVLVQKRCLCQQEIRNNVPCHINVVSCGKACGKELSCGLHKCLKICHKGACLVGDEQCQQPCPISRRDCPHPCGAPCHIGQDCPEGPCKSQGFSDTKFDMIVTTYHDKPLIFSGATFRERFVSHHQITIKCRCGRKTEKVLCLAGNSKVQFQRFATDSVGDKLRNLRSGQSVDISGLMIAEKRGGLECDEECAMIERNKRLAEALGVENPDGNHFPSLPFSYFLKEEAKKQLPLVKVVEDAIENLIHKIKKTSLVQISHSFQPMNSTQRKLVHELAEHYNCKTTSYDPEPRRNTVITATRESVLVVPKLSTVIERKSKPLLNPILSLEEKPLNFQRMQKRGSQDELQSTRVSTIDYFDDDF